MNTSGRVKLKSIISIEYDLLFVKSGERDIVVTTSVRCMCIVHACVCPSIQNCLCHNLYIYAWISK